MDERLEVAVACRILAREGCESQVPGHVSRRHPSGDGFSVSAFGYFDEAVPDHVVHLGFDLSVRSGTATASNAVRFHAAIYQARPDVGAVVHTHSRYVATFSTVERPVGMFNSVSTLFLDRQGLYADDGTHPPVDGGRLVTALGDGTVVLLAQHGAIVVGPTLADATIGAVYLEMAARFDIEASAIGGREMPRAEALVERAAYESIIVPEMWDANQRRLRRSDPDLFT